MIGMLKVQLPEIFTVDVGNNKKPFQCSDTFVGRFVNCTLGWSKRKGTQAGQKLPADADDQMEAHLFRIAIAISDNDIPESCVVNGDQMGNVFAQPGLSTYDEIGTNQVAIVGNTGGKGLWKQAGTCQEHGRDRIHFPEMYPPNKYQVYL